MLADAQIQAHLNKGMFEKMNKRRKELGKEVLLENCATFGKHEPTPYRLVSGHEHQARDTRVVMRYSDPDQQLGGWFVIYFDSPPT